MNVSLYPARRAIAALLLLLAGASPLAAQGVAPFDDPDERQEQLEPPLSLPEGLGATIRPNPQAPSVPRVNRIADVFVAIQSCWRPPSGSGYSGQEITLRMSFKRNGEVLGQPKITYYNPGTVQDQREPFTRSVREAFVRCTPLPVSESLGRAIAGRIFTFRFIDAQPM
ncbi:hypothetical protein AB4Y85_00080 [Microvirga sp. 2YAF29]|uniref:hypothetical protein n=1 Tax=Microvirga sp. 2YAF29 TaxID=3233031 RepID=UPI003F9592D8